MKLILQYNESIEKYFLLLAQLDEAKRKHGLNRDPWLIDQLEKKLAGCSRISKYIDSKFSNHKSDGYTFDKDKAA